MRAEDFLKDVGPASLVDGSISWHDPDSKYDSYIVVKAIPPTWRDLWAILRGRYEPQVRMYRQLTLKGQNQCLKATWTTERLEEQLYSRSPLFDHFK